MPIVLLDWRVTERLTLRTRQDVILTYAIGTRRRLLLVSMASFFQRRQFLMNESAVLPGGVVEIGGYTAGCRIIWRAVPGLTLEGTVQAPLDQNLRAHNRSGLKVVDVGVEGGLQLSVTARYRHQYGCVSNMGPVWQWVSPHGWPWWPVEAARDKSRAVTSRVGLPSCWPSDAPQTAG